MVNGAVAHDFAMVAVSSIINPAEHALATVAEVLLGSEGAVIEASMCYAVLLSSPVPHAGTTRRR